MRTRDVLTIFGAIFILTGFISMRYSNSPSEIRANVPVVAVDGKWSASGYFAKGENMLVNIYQGGDWYTGQFDPPIYSSDPQNGFLFLDVNITDPTGNITGYEVKYTPRSNLQPPITLWSINVTRHAEAGLNTTSFYNEVKNSYKGMGGITEYNGTYTVDLGNLYPPREEPPSRIEIRKDTTTTEYPYTFLLPTGAAIAAAGVGFLLFAYKDYRETKKKRIKGKK
jgi:hypothetical protein